MSRVSVFLILAIASIQNVSSAEPLEKTYLRLTVTMTDAEGDRLVPGLTKEDLQLFDRGTPQFIEYFSATPSPSSVTILLDMDGSMQAMELNNSLKRLIDVCNAQSVPDEVSLIAFSAKPTEVKNFAWRVSSINFGEVLRLLEGKNRYGETGLEKALSLAGERLQAQARNYNRAVILITDAEEDLSHSSALRIQNQIETMGVRVYGIFFPGENRLDHGRLHNLAVMTGGRYFQITEPSPLELLIRWIFHELRHQYVIGFTPRPRQSEVERSDISIKLSNPWLIPGISVRFTSTKAIGRTQEKESGQ